MLTSRTLLALLASVIISAWPEYCRAQDTCHRPGPRVYILRGACGYFPEASAMAEQVRCRGFEPVVLFASQWRFARWQILRDYEDSCAQGPVIVIGYSLGAAAAVELARSLNREGIPVDKLLLIECFTRANIPENVRYCFNIYETRPLDRYFIFRGTPVSSVSPCTRLVEIDIARDRVFCEHSEDLHHFNLTTCPTIRHYVTSQLPDLRMQ